MADGFGGSGYIDPATGEWVSTPGTGINGMPRVINTPNSSTGQPAFQDPSANAFDSPFATPQGGQLTTTTPNSSTGAPAPGIRTLPATQSTSANPNDYVNNLVKQFGANYVRNNWSRITSILGLGDLALPASLAAIPLVASTTSTAPKSMDELPRRYWPTQTQPGPGRSPSGPVPPGGPPYRPEDDPRVIPPVSGGPTVIPPFNVSPPARPAATPTPPSRPRGALSPSSGSPPAALAPGTSLGRVNPADVNLGHYRASVGNAQGATWVPGGEDSPAPQIFRGPLTMFGAGPATAPGKAGAQNYYTPGSAPLAPGDWGWPVAPAAAPAMRQTGNARGGGGGGAAAPMPAPAPRMSRVDPNMGPMQQGSVFPSQMGPNRNPGPMDPSIIAHLKMLFGGQDPGSVMPGP